MITYVHFIPTNVFQKICFLINFSLKKKEEPPKYKKKILKKGDKINIPRKGDTVAVWYTGRLEDGTVFDTNVVTGRWFHNPGFLYTAIFLTNGLCVVYHSLMLYLTLMYL